MTEVQTMTAPPFWTWMAQQHLNRDPARAAAAVEIRDRFGFFDGYSHQRVMRKLGQEDSPHLRAAQALADEYGALFGVSPSAQMATYGAISPLVPLALEQCNYVGKKNLTCGRDAVPGTGRCGHHGGQWVTEQERATIVKEISGRLVDISDRAVRVISDLMDNGRSEKVRLDAAIAVLDRIGVGPTTKVELGITDNAESTALEVMSRLEGLRAAADRQDKTIIGEVNEDEHVAITEFGEPDRAAGPGSEDGGAGGDRPGYAQMVLELDGT